MLQKLGLTSTAADRRAAERSDFRPGAGNRSANDADN
jgi:hypothetical protein